MQTEIIQSSNFEVRHVMDPSMLSDIILLYGREYRAYKKGLNDGLVTYHHDGVPIPPKFFKAEIDVYGPHTQRNRKTLGALFSIYRPEKRIIGWGEISEMSGKAEGIFEISRYISYRERGKGAGTKLAYEMLEFARNNLQANYVVSRMDENNFASKIALDKAAAALDLDVMGGEYIVPQDKRSKPNMLEFFIPLHEEISEEIPEEP